MIAAIDRNTRELAQLRGKMDRFTWEMKRMADHSDRKGKGKAWPEETEEEEEESDDVSDVDAEASANHFVLDSSGQCHTEPQSPQLSPYWTALSR